jgi:hypothetical protein
MSQQVLTHHFYTAFIELRENIHMTAYEMCTPTHGALKELTFARVRGFLRRLLLLLFFFTSYL